MDPVNLAIGTVTVKRQVNYQVLISDGAGGSYIVAAQLNQGTALALQEAWRVLLDKIAAPRRGILQQIYQLAQKPDPLRSHDGSIQDRMEKISSLCLKLEKGNYENATGSTIDQTEPIG